MNKENLLLNAHKLKDDEEAHSIPSIGLRIKLLNPPNSLRNYNLMLLALIFNLSVDHHMKKHKRNSLKTFVFFRDFSACAFG
jgi:hypothetical protein